MIAKDVSITIINALCMIWFYFVFRLLLFLFSGQTVIDEGL